jgi:dihydropteroate synthase
MRLTLGEHVIECTNRTAVMGILNVSHDSPVADSMFDPSAALDRAVALHKAGAEIVDVGAVSTTTDGRELTSQEEIERVCPVIEATTGEGIPTSVDTWNPTVARAAAEAGAHVLNDVSGLTDPEMIAVATEFRLPGLVMHMRGRPQHHWDVDQTYENVATEVRGFLLDRAVAIEAAGAPRPWIDPGFDFGKSLDDNLRLFESLPELVETGYPVVISLSRKPMLGEMLGYPTRQDVPHIVDATVAVNALAAEAGVHVVRVHDAAKVAGALRVVNEMRRRRAEAAGA